jgi:branched-chain amino acid transport system substrate-binding protein
MHPRSIGRLILFKVLARLWRAACWPLAVAVLLAAAGCGTGDAAGSADEIRIGHYASMTGSEATFGQSTDNGIRLAVDDLNASGGIKGRKIRLITYDERGDAQEVGTVVTRLITRDRVVAILGEVASGLSLAGAPVCQENGVPMLTPSSTDPRVTKVGNMIFRVCFTTPFQGYACAKFARESPQLHASKAAILVDRALPYSVGLKQDFERVFVELGGRILLTRAYQAGDQDFSAQLTEIRGAAPDVIFVPGYYTDVGNIALQARKLGIRTPLLGGDGWDSAKLTEIAGPAVEGCFFCTHYSPQDPNPRVQQFLARYREAHGEAPDAMAALGYDAARILFQAISRAPSLSGQDIAAALAATRDFDGVTGRITIDKDRNAVKPAVILEIKHGIPTLVETIQPR